MRARHLTGVFYLKLFIMKYLLDCVMLERTLTIHFNEDIDCLTLEIKDNDSGSISHFAMDEDGLFELIGVLHHLQKQMK